MTPTDEISEWILHASLENSAAASGRDRELLRAANKVWPQVLLYAQRHLPREWSAAEKQSFAMELWAKVLGSVARTLARKDASRSPVLDLEAYLAGIFQHRVHRFLVRERQRGKIVSFVSPEELAACESSRAGKATANPDRQIQLKEIISRMDEWMKEVWTARMYGYSWADIGAMVSLTEQQTKMRFRYALAKIRTQLSNGGKASAIHPERGHLS